MRYECDREHVCVNIIDGGTYVPICYEYVKLNTYSDIVLASIIIDELQFEQGWQLCLWMRMCKCV